jgi:hypothetical protein
MFENIFPRRKKLVKPPEPDKHGDLRDSERTTPEPLSRSYSPALHVADQSERSPYENVLTGAFILALGHRLGATGKLADEVFANLFQQTPMDQFLADLMTENDFRGFLLEFKRDWSERLAEAKKEKFKIIIIAATNNSSIWQRNVICWVTASAIVGVSTSNSAAISKLYVLGKSMK